MKNFKSFFKEDGNVLFSARDIILGSKVSVFLNFADTKFVSQKNLKEEASKAISAVSYLKKSGEIGKEKISFLTKEEFYAAKEKYFISCREYSKSKIFIKENSFYWAFNFRDHAEISSFCEDSDNIVSFLPRLLSRRKDMNLFSTLAFSNEFGFLTAEPIRCGNLTEIKSVIHLPALKKNGKISQISKEASFLNMRLTSLFDDLPDTGDFYLLTAYGGFSREEEFANKTVLFLKGVKEREKEERKKVFLGKEFEDAVFRSLAILKSCRLLGFYESMTLLSFLKSGVDAGIINASASLNISQALSSFHPKILSFYNGKKNISLESIRADLSVKIFSQFSF
ncbi:MAG: hypothetical protein AB1637_08370 [Elusimicrobiota bacterium]